MMTNQLTNESTENTTHVFSGLDLLFDLKPLFIPLYALLVTIACLGNCVLILLIAFTKKLHNTTNFLIGNLAASDLVMCIFCVPLTASYAFEVRGWLFGEFMCHYVPLMQAATVFVSVLSLTAIAVDRYVVVVYPIRRRIGCRSCVYIVTVIWVVSIGISLPSFMHTYHVDLSSAGHDMIICEESWRSQETLKLLYSCTILLLSYMLPLSAITISYCAIAYHLRRRNVPGAASHNQEKWSKKKQKTFRMLIISVMAFAICWLPLQVVNLIRDIDEDFSILDKNYINVIQVTCHFIAMSSACYNPFIYASLHDKFRFHLRNYFYHHKMRASTMSNKNSRLNTCSTLADVPIVLSDKMTFQGRCSFN